MTIRRKRLSHAALVGAAFALFAVFFAPARTLAWIERTTRSRVATRAITGIIGPMGCAMQTTSVTHGTGSSPFSVIARAATMGVTAADQQLCNSVTDPGILKLIRGRTTVSLLKLRTAGIGSNPDQYDYCQFWSTRQTNWVSELNGDRSWSKAPCGTGYYALVACLDADIVLTDGVLGIGGSFYAANNSQCNVSPNWHPAMPDSTGVGTPVKL